MCRQTLALYIYRKCGHQITDPVISQCDEARKNGVQCTGDKLKDVTLGSTRKRATVRRALTKDSPTVDAPTTKLPRLNTYTVWYLRTACVSIPSVPRNICADLSVWARRGWTIVLRHGLR